MPLSYLGPRDPPRRTWAQPFGFFLFKDGKWGFICFTKDTQLDIGWADSVKELYACLTRWDTPALWYSFDIRDFFYTYLQEVASDEWLLTKVGKNATDKVLLVSTGESELLKVVFNEEKAKKISKKKVSLTIINASYIYPKSTAEDLAKDFLQEQEPATHNTLLLNAWMGLCAIYEFCFDKLKVSPSITFSSTVLKALQVGFIKTKVPKLSQELEEFIKPALFGGKTEVYRILDPHAWIYDKDGLYNEASTYPLPVKEAYAKTNLTPQQLMEMDDIGYVDVDIHINEALHKGPLPVRTSHGVVFPVGPLRSTKERPIRFFTPLLKQAALLNQVEILKVNFGIFFRVCSPLLQDWAEYAAKLKLEARSRGERHLAKLCQNVLWGKFVQAEERLITHLGTVPKDRLRDQSITIIDDDIPIWFETVKVRLASHLPHLAAAITSWALSLMLKDVVRLESLGIPVDYTDTDSLFVGKRLPEDMVGTGLGKYKEEHRDVFAFCPAAKLYYLWNNRTNKIMAALKGIPGYEPTKEDMDKLLQGQRLSFEFASPIPLAQVIVDKFLYRRFPERFPTVLNERNNKQTRTLPGLHRDVKSVLDFDTKRKQLSLQESRPLHIDECSR